jgi:hypothetical protein
MNIFALDEDPVQAAKYHCDRHVVKMILEHCQLMAHVLWDFNLPCCFLKSKAFYNHPCAKWVRSSYSNYIWLRTCTLALLEEKTIRYGTDHKLAKDFLVWWPENIPLVDIGLTRFANCTPYKDMEDVVAAYHLYYNRHKSYFAKWTNSAVPHWYRNELDLADEYTRNKIFSLKRPSAEIKKIKEDWLLKNS